MQINFFCRSDRVVIVPYVCIVVGVLVLMTTVKWERKNGEQNKKKKNNVGIYIYKAFVTCVGFTGINVENDLYYSINQMSSSVQRRAKNISKIPLVNMTETGPEIPFNDPRSPSANVSR